ncbi:UNVERIFIED_ORG: hypothetical protein GGE64_006463 [Rhizobium etli]
MRITYLRGKGFKIEVEPAFITAAITLIQLLM